MQTHEKSLKRACLKIPDIKISTLSDLILIKCHAIYRSPSTVWKFIAI